MSDNNPLAPNANLDKHGPTSPRQSKLGMTSFILGLISALIIMGLALLLIVFALLSPGRDRESLRSLDAAVAGGLVLGLLAAVILPAFGIGLGLTGILRKNGRHGLAITGLISNAVILIFALSIIAIYFLLLAAVEHAISC